MKKEKTGRQRVKKIKVHAGNGDGKLKKERRDGRGDSEGWGKGKWEVSKFH